MQITYINHSGFMLELEHVWMLFDYYNGEIPPIPSGKQGFVFASHRHPDHFNPEIFQLASEGEISFILSGDIWKKRVPDAVKAQTVHMKPDTELELNGIRIQTLRSTDEGVAFLVQAEGKTIYHAGDLNHWRWEEESDEWNAQMEKDFHAYIEPLRNKKIDVAFLPLDPRQEAYYALGMDYFLELTETRKVYPMHFWGKPEIIKRWHEEHPDSIYRDRIVNVVQGGDTFYQES